jgi:hypothetical protein
MSVLQRAIDSCRAHVAGVHVPALVLIFSAASRQAGAADPRLARKHLRRVLDLSYAPT